MRRRALQCALVGAILMLVVTVTTEPAVAGQREFGVSWNVALPLGNTSDFTKNISFRGITIDYHAFRSQTTSWGLNIGWTVFTENPDDTFVGDGFAITGERWNYINAVPIYASFFKYWGEVRRPQYFMGLNAGTIWAEYRTTVGLYSMEEEAWHAAIAPEIGMKMPMRWLVDYATLRFNLGFPASGVDTQSWLELRIGFGR